MKSKKSQAELITSVLLVVISITAVIVLSGFVFNLVNQNLKKSECFNLAGQIQIDTDYSYFRNSSKTFYLSIKRAETDFNLTGIKIVYGNDKSSKSVNLYSGNSSLGVYNINLDGNIDNTNLSIKIPAVGMSRAYAFDILATDSVNYAEIYPILIGNQICDKADEEKIEARA